MTSFHDVLQAQKRILSFVHRTPVFTSATVDKLTGRKVFFKAEHLQKTGAFKARGAINAILSLKEKNPKVPGVVTHSSGNHGMAVAWAAQITGMNAVVVVPNNTPAIKAKAIEDYGAELVYCEPSPQSRIETCKALSEKRNLTIIPPYDHYDVIAGQGTIAMELMEQVPELDAILVPISGGGMTSGIAIAAKYMKPSIKVFAVEPKGKDLEKCLCAGERLWPNPPRFVNTIAEGIRTQQVGMLTFPILKELVEKEVFTVTDDEMIQTMKFAMQRMKFVIEASSAAGVAAVISEKMKEMDPAIKNIGVILCGGNVDLDNLPWQAS
ncbi:serine racemase-like [Lineus longissimus]|uniref:serine racemase-like n=1 Tax=Lineus longissimus TaxID=88925 RepID=UPI002B4D8DD7